jgi:hypothetical protein
MFEHSTNQTVCPRQEKFEHSTNQTACLRQEMFEHSTNQTVCPRQEMFEHSTNQTVCPRQERKRNAPDLVQAFLKKWWVESDFKAPNLPLSLWFKGSGCHYNSI